MLRIKLTLILFVALGALSATAMVLAGRAETRLVIQAEDAAKTGAEVVKLANRVDEYSLITAARDAASIRGIADAMKCPRTPEELAASNREQTPAVDPVTLQPILDAAGRPLDTDGAPIRERTGPRCTATQHQEVLRLVSQWNLARREAISRNDDRFLADRDAGFAIAREPDLLIVSDADGVVVARVGLEMDSWFGANRPNMARFPHVARAALGQPQYGNIVWREYDAAPPQLVQIGVVPIQDEARQFLGTVLLGNFLTDAAAVEDQQLGVGLDVAYFHIDAAGAAVFAGTSFLTRPAFLSSMQNAPFFQRRDDRSVASDSIAFRDFARRGSLSAFEFSVDGRRHVAVARPLEEDDDGTPMSGFIVVTSISDATSALQAFRTLIPVVALLLVLLGGFLFIVVLRSFLSPIDDISKGIQEVVAGNHDYMWEVDDKNHLSDLAHSLNVMSARLQGKRDPDEEESEGDTNWGGMVGGAPAGGGEARKPAGVVGLGNLRGRSQSGSTDE